jgi:ketosteroid isomerase-like protein
MCHFFQTKTAQCLLLALLTTVLCTNAAFAQTDEDKLRNAIKIVNEGTPAKVTDDVIVWAGVSEQPTVGKQAWEATRQGIVTARPNLKLNRTTERLVISESKDLAYEYGKHVSSWDKPEGGGRDSNAGYYLRIWRKVDGEWLEEAFFARLMK